MTVSVVGSLVVCVGVVSSGTCSVVTSGVVGMSVVVMLDDTCVLAT